MNSRITVNLFLLLTITLVQPTNAQNEIIEEIVNTAEKPPMPYGGLDSLYKWIDKNMIWQQGQMTTIGRVYIETVIDTTGTLTEIKIIKGLTEEANKEALRLAQQVPPWIPAEQRGKKLSWRIVIPITFGEL
jgi:periplasmic protein TonB